MEYRYATGMGSNPASVEMETGLVTLNAELWHELPEFVKKFILKHEEGHYLLDTDSENEADYYALKKLYKTENESLQKIIEALAYFLPEDDKRVMQLYIRALLIDYKLNGNEKAKERLKELIMRNKTAGYTSAFVAPVDQALGNVGNTIFTAEETAVLSTENKEKSNKKQKRMKLQFAGYEFSLTEILLFAILFVLILKLN